MNGIKTQILIHVFFPLLAGYFIYFFFRPDYWFVEVVQKRESLFQNLSLNSFQKLIIFSGPDFCWSYSLGSALYIWEQEQLRRVIIFPALVSLILISSEIIQIFFKKSFTFDTSDIVAALVASFLSYCFLYKK